MSLNQLNSIKLIELIEKIQRLFAHLLFVHLPRWMTSPAHGLSEERLCELHASLLLLFEVI